MRFPTSSKVCIDSYQSVCLRMMVNIRGRLKTLALGQLFTDDLVRWYAAAFEAISIFKWRPTGFLPPSCLFLCRSIIGPLPESRPSPYSLSKSNRYEQILFIRPPYPQTLVRFLSSMRLPLPCSVFWASLRLSGQVFQLKPAAGSIML